MIKVTSQEFQKRPGLYQDKALKESLTITHYGRDRLVLMDVDEFNQLRKRARVVLGIHQLSTEDKKNIELTTMSSRHNHLNNDNS